MTMGYKVQRDVAAAIGEPSSSLDRLFAELGKAKLTDTGPWQVEHIGRSIFALAAPKPNKGPATVKTLELIPHSESDPPKLKPIARSLGLAFYRIISVMSEPLIRGQELPDSYVAMIESWGMDLCPELLQAEIYWNDSISRVSYIYSYRDPRPMPGMWRVTHISGAVLLTAAKHLADTIINENALAAVQFLDRTKPGKGSVQEQRNADTFGGRLSAFLDSQPEDQPSEQITRADGVLPDPSKVSPSGDASKDELNPGFVKTS